MASDRQAKHWSRRPAPPHGSRAGVSLRVGAVQMPPADASKASPRVVVGPRGDRPNIHSQLGRRDDGVCPKTHSSARSSPRNAHRPESSPRNISSAPEISLPDRGRELARSTIGYHRITVKRLRSGLIPAHSARIAAGCVKLIWADRRTEFDKKGWRWMSAPGQKRTIFHRDEARFSSRAINPAIVPSLIKINCVDYGS
jgi:hypothetical protein